MILKPENRYAPFNRKRSTFRLDYVRVSHYLSLFEDPRQFLHLSKELFPCMKAFSGLVILTPQQFEGAPDNLQLIEEVEK